MKKLNQKDKRLLKISGIPNPNQWKKKQEGPDSSTYVNTKTGQSVTIRR